MLDADEVAEYEAWKQHKLTSQVDLSVAAYNTEMESVALAWEAGARAMFNEKDSADDLQAVLAKNPNRVKGMRGYRGTDSEIPAAPTARRVTSTPEPVSETPDEGYSGSPSANEAIY